MPKKNTEITVAYWSTKDLGAPLRQMVLYLGFPLKCILYKTTAVQTQDGLSVEGSHWHLGAKPAHQKINPLINLPYVEVHDADQKIVVAQSIADFALFEMLNQYACLIRFFELISCENGNPAKILEACQKTI